MTVPPALAKIEELIAAATEHEHSRLQALREEMWNLAPG
jgi:hypothetical protein